MLIVGLKYLLLAVLVSGDTGDDLLGESVVGSSGLAHGLHQTSEDKSTGILLVHSLKG